MIEIIDSSIELIDDPLWLESHAKKIERCGRTCYKSEDRITDASADPFCEMLIRRGHESVVEHSHVTFKFTCSRACAQQLTRHRIASYSMESQRYVNYKGGIRVIDAGFSGPLRELWIEVQEQCAYMYGSLVDFHRAKPEDARSVLTNATATEVIATMNHRSWRNFLRQRLDKHAQKEIRFLAGMVLDVMLEHCEPLYRDIEAKRNKTVENTREEYNYQKEALERLGVFLENREERLKAERSV